MTRVHRIIVVGVIFVVVYLTNFAVRGPFAGYESFFITADDTHDDGKKHNVWCHTSNVQNCLLCPRQRRIYPPPPPSERDDSLNRSTKLLQIDDRHATEVSWLSSDLTAIMGIAKESMQIRLARSGRDVQKNYTQTELNAIDPQWKLFYVEWSDRGVGDSGIYQLKRKLAPFVGWKRLHYVSRSVQNDRYMQHWVKKSMDGSDGIALDFGTFIGQPINFTQLLVEEFVASVQRVFLPTRDDIAEAIDKYMEEQHPRIYQAAKDTGGDVGLAMSEDIASLPRPTDVRTFWNSTICNLNCEFRNLVSEIVGTIPQRNPNVTVDTNVYGSVRHRGRHSVHSDYIEAMLSTKIIVLAQRDKWEDHFRFDEALLSGALVMTEPQIYYPHGVVDGENLLIYHSMVELESMIHYYLLPEHEQSRISIGRRGRELALSEHRTWQQAERLVLNDVRYRNEYGISNKPWKGNDKNFHGI